MEKKGYIREKTGEGVKKARRRELGMSSRSTKREENLHAGVYPEGHGGVGGCRQLEIGEQGALGVTQGLGQEEALESRRCRRGEEGNRDGPSLSS